MDLIELILLSFSSLRRNILRTLLTMLGIIIGIASVIIIMSLGAGATASIVSQISSFGANNLTISPGSFQRGPVRSGIVTTLVREDAKAIDKQISNIEAISSTVSNRYQIVANGENSNVSVNGVNASIITINNLTLTAGNFINTGQVTGNSRVAVVGDETIFELFGENSDQFVIGETIKIDSRPFRIIGVIQDTSTIYIPISTAMNVLMGRNYVDSITVQVKSADLIDTTQTAIENLLIQRHEIIDPNNPDFTIRSAQEIISTISDVTGTLTAMLSAIAAISLVVGGIGIMNIMLVTVTERTKEIGLLKALGAKRKDILTQFLIESIVVTLTGGLIGMTLGLIITYFISQALEIQFIIGIRSVSLAVGVSTAVGLVFGFYPAQRAARLNPIDALRYE